MNAEVMNELRNAAKIQPGSRETFPSNLSGSIVPIIDVTPKNVKDAIVKSSQAAASGTIALIATTDFPNQNVRIYSASIGISKDVTCDIATGQVSITAVINGLSRNIIAIPVLTLTAQHQTISVTFPRGILIDRSTAVSSAGTFTAGACARSVAISYTVDEQTNG